MNYIGIFEYKKKKKIQCNKKSSQCKACQKLTITLQKKKIKKKNY